jgi:hypothetical protein
MQVTEVIQTQSVDDPQAGVGSFGLGDGDGAIQLHDGRAGHPASARPNQIPLASSSRPP